MAELILLFRRHGEFPTVELFFGLMVVAALFLIFIYHAIRTLFSKSEKHGLTKISASFESSKSQPAQSPTYAGIELQKSQGFRYTKEDLYNIEEHCGMFSMLNYGFNGKLRNFVHGIYNSGLFCIFTYEYSTSASKKNPSLENYPCMVLISDKMELNFHFSLSSEVIAESLSTGLARIDVSTFEGIDPFAAVNFNTRFTLTGEDSENARIFFDTQMLNYLTSFPRSVVLEADGNHLLVKLPPTVESPAEFEEYMKFVTGIVENLSPAALKLFEYTGKKQVQKKLRRKRIKTGYSAVDRYNKSLREEQARANSHFNGPFP